LVALRASRKVEEVPRAYDPIGTVIEPRKEADLIRPLARLPPQVTFKARGWVIPPCDYRAPLS